ncbi:MAG: hypothetical protein D6820_04040 [Lentisphaerae bacterium]|nr:MAG: hypothetical protein D6820_04040 [Lentisphaerota bacterium]
MSSGRHRLRCRLVIAGTNPDQAEPAADPGIGRETFFRQAADLLGTAWWTVLKLNQTMTEALARLAAGCFIGRDAYSLISGWKLIVCPRDKEALFHNHSDHPQDLVLATLLSEVDEYLLDPSPGRMGNIPCEYTVVEPDS